ncbi:MAG: tRNA (adenosine(37)-N6)-threonylcarbamoyltransferase complex dimerization subunit type 1 TsaB [Deltaproteobacteria bacterium]|nr:tRNA (adenosine(37)-N6)-threonylcarbamoyltransferase complex dimerization subunit type 1 TsaB [Deltaproteobacteria bacterium]
MKILAVDTATPTCGVAIVDDERVCASMTINPGCTHSRSVMGLIKSALDAACVSVPDIDAFAITTGPGSFTGLRIGMAVIKGLAMAAGKPVCGVSSLEALAAPFVTSTALVCSIIDARKHEVYFAVYGNDEGRLVEVQPAGVGPVAAVTAAIKTPCLFVGTGAYAAKREILESLGESAVFVPAGSNLINPTFVAGLARTRLCEHGPDLPETLAPVYVRPPDAKKSL